MSKEDLEFEVRKAWSELKVSEHADRYGFLLKYVSFSHGGIEYSLLFPRVYSAGEEEENLRRYLSDLRAAAQGRELPYGQRTLFEV